MSRALSNDRLKTLAADVLRLSHRLTRERANLPASYLKDRGLREAYEAYYLPPNLRKIQAPLRELMLHPGRVLQKDKIRILDLGCGPGTSTIGTLEFFVARERRPELEFVAVDQVAENLQVAAALFSPFQSKNKVNASLHTIRICIENILSLAEKPFDLIILSNVLNEMYARCDDRIAKRIDLLTGVNDRLLGDEGSCIIIEPALRETSRELLMVREGLLERGFRIFAPCLSSISCPALANPKDWCHEAIPWDPPDLIRELDKRTGLRKDSLKFSYLTLRKDEHALADMCGRDAFRVVSEPLPSKGKLEFYLCGSGGRKLAALLNRDRTTANDDYGSLQRGDLVNLRGLIDEGKRFRIGKDTTVTRLLPNQPCSSAEEERRGNVQPHVST